MTKDLYNRQLHPEEKTLAKQLADKSGGKYTQAQIEDQLRIMGVSVSVSVSVNGTDESGAPTTLVGQAPTDSGAQWIGSPSTSDGQTVLTQKTALADPALQSYILANYNSASANQVPSQLMYPLTGNSGSMNITGPFTKFDQSDVAFMRGTTADVAGFAGTQLDRTSALATALASAGMSVPGISVPAESVAIWSSAASWLAGGIQQIAKPDVGTYTVSNIISQMTGKFMGQYPLAAPLINETGNVINNSGAAQSVQDWVNGKIKR